MNLIFNIALFVFLALLIPTAYAAKIGAPYAPTFMPAIKNAFKYIKLKKGDTLVDLGAGDGKVLIEATRQGANAIGYELSPVMWFVVWLRLLTNKQGKIYLRNFLKQKLPASTSIIFIFLMPEHMQKVHDYLKKQHLPNARYIVVYSFPFPDVTPIHIVHTPKCGRIFVYDPKDLTRASK